MSYLPLFIDTAGKACLIVGGGKIASRKLVPVLKSKMSVTIISPDIIDEIKENTINVKNFKYIQRKFVESDINNQFLVVAATNDKKNNSLIAKIAKEKNILVNIAEDSLSGDTLIPSVVDRNPIKIAISSGGASPILTRLVKTKLEAVIPYSFSKLAEIMMEYRDKVKNSFVKITDRRNFWEIFLDGPISEMVLSGHIDKARKALDESLKYKKVLEKTGEVYFCDSEKCKQLDTPIEIFIEEEIEEDKKSKVPKLPKKESKVPKLPKKESKIPKLPEKKD